MILFVSICEYFLLLFLSQKQVFFFALKADVQARCGINLARYSDHSLFPRIFSSSIAEAKKMRNTTVHVLPAHNATQFLRPGKKSTYTRVADESSNHICAVASFYVTTRKQLFRRLSRRVPPFSPSFLHYVTMNMHSLSDRERNVERKLHSGKKNCEKAFGSTYFACATKKVRN